MSITRIIQIIGFLVCMAVAVMLGRISTRQKSNPPTPHVIQTIKSQSEQIRQKPYSNEDIVDSLHRYLPSTGKRTTKRTVDTVPLKRGKRIPGHSSGR